VRTRASWAAQRGAYGVDEGYTEGIGRTGVVGLIKGAGGWQPPCGSACRHGCACAIEENVGRGLCPLTTSGADARLLVHERSQTMLLVPRAIWRDRDF